MGSTKTQTALLLVLEEQSRRWKYYGYCNYKFGNDFRPNSDFEAIHGHINIKRQLNERTSVSFEFTKSLSDSSTGGLTDNAFLSDPILLFAAEIGFKLIGALLLYNSIMKLIPTLRVNSRTF